jgi:hypothetical protein
MIWKISEKKNKAETQNTVEGHSSKLEQAEDRISEHEDKMEIKGKTEKLLAIKGKTEDLLVKQLRTCKRIMQKNPSKDHT